MATPTSIFPVNSERKVALALVAATPSASIVIGSSASATIFVITVDSDTNIRFGNVNNIGNPDATDFPIWANSYMTFQLPVGCDRIRLFSTAGGNAWVWPLGRS